MATVLCIAAASSLLPLAASSFSTAIQRDPQQIRPPSLLKMLPHLPLSSRQKPEPSQDSRALGSSLPLCQMSHTAPLLQPLLPFRPPLEPQYLCTCWTLTQDPLPSDMPVSSPHFQYSAEVSPSQDSFPRVLLSILVFLYSSNVTSTGRYYIRNQNLFSVFQFSLPFKMHLYEPGSPLKVQPRSSEATAW